MNPGKRSSISETGDNETRWKGFRALTLANFGITVDQGDVRIPYLTRAGDLYRVKLFRIDGSQRWLGPSKPLIPYGAETLGNGRVVYVTEGESDALTLRVAFPDAAVLGVPGASSWKSEWARLLAPFDAVYLSFDADRAGESLLEAVKQDVPNCRVVLLPDGADTRDVLQLLGRRAYNILVEVADRSYETSRAWANLDEAVHRRQRVVEAWQARDAA